MRYSNLEEEGDTAVAKIRRSVYLIISISLLTHTFSLVYSLLTLKESSAAFISIIVSALSCFFISNSHLTIYGISVLGSLYISMIKSYYTVHQLFYIVALSGIIMFAFWKPLHSLGTIFHCLPGKIHASLVFGIVLIVLSRVMLRYISVLPSRHRKHPGLLLPLLRKGHGQPLRHFQPALPKFQPGHPGHHHSSPGDPVPPEEETGEDPSDRYNGCFRLCGKLQPHLQVLLRHLRPVRRGLYILHR